MVVSLKFLLCCFLAISCAYATIVSHDGRAITIDGHRRVLLSGSIHYPRSTPEVMKRNIHQFISTHYEWSYSIIMFRKVIN